MEDFFPTCTIVWKGNKQQHNCFTCSYVLLSNTCKNIPTTKPTYKLSIPLSGFYFATFHYYRMDSYVHPSTHIKASASYLNS